MSLSRTFVLVLLLSASVFWAQGAAPANGNPPGTGTGLLGQYFNTPDLSSSVSPFNVPVLSRLDPQIDFLWTNTSPDLQVNPTNFSVRWIGQLQARFSESHTFYLTTDDGARLWINGQLIIDAWNDQPPTTFSAAINLNAGEKVAIKLEYYQRLGQSVAKLEWSSPSQPREVIPASQLYSDSGFTARLPRKSQTSPVFIEGTSWSAGGLPYRIKANGIQATAISDNDWFVNVPLRADGKDSNISIKQSATGATDKSPVMWTPTDLTNKDSSTDSVVIRKGDALLLTASQSGMPAIKIDPDGTGYALSGHAGDLFQAPYNSAGVFVATAMLSDTQKVVGSILVTVVDTNLASFPIADAVGFAREKNVVVYPPKSAQYVTFLPADIDTLNVAANAPYSSPVGDGTTLTLKAVKRGTPVVLARLGGPQGPIVSYKEVDEYTYGRPALLETVVNGDTGTGTTILVISPYIPDLKFELTMFAHSSTFSGGSKVLTINTSDIDTLTGLPKFKQVFNTVTNEVEGIMNIDLEVPDIETKYCFRLSATQSSTYALASAPAPVAAPGVPAAVSRDAQYTDEQPIQQTTNNNGCICKAKIKKIVLCVGGIEKTLDMPTTPCSAGSTHDLQIFNCFGAVFKKSNDTFLAKGFDCKIANNSQVVYSPANASNGYAGVMIGETAFQDVIAVVDLSVTADRECICLKSPVKFTATANFASSQQGTITWSGGDDPPTGTGTEFTTKFTSSGQKTVTATWSLNGDSCSATKTVTAIEIKSLTVSDAMNPDIKATDPSDTQLTVCLNNSGEAKIKIDADINPSTDDTKKCVRWKVIGGSATPADGDFTAGPPMVTLKPGTRSFTVQVGCDENNNKKLEASEVVRTLKVNIPKVVINSIDPRFAPSVEKLDVKYTIEPDGATAKFAKLEVFKNGDDMNPIFVDDKIPKTGANVLYQWDGKTTAGKYAGPQDSPYTVRITLSDKADFSDVCSMDKKTTKVEIHSIELNKSAAEMIVMNDPATKVEVIATVKIKDKAGKGVVTACEIKVDWTFTDPNPANTPKANSYEYDPGKFLGKAGDAASIYWGAHPDSASGSDDGFKMTAFSNTITAAGGDQGKAKIFFLPSAVGGDDFKLTATVKSNKDASVLATKDSAVLTVWRQVKFDNLFEMNGINQISTESAKGKIQPTFDPAFVIYEAAATTAIPAAESVKYIGLWKNDGTHQQDWNAIKAKLAAETPTAQELADYAGADAAKKAAAKIAITAKAQAWVVRIDNAYFAAQNLWLANGKPGAFPNNSIVGIQYFHPKYNPRAGDSATNEWPAGITVTTYGGNYPGINPDSSWAPGGGDFGGLSLGNGIIAIPKGFAAATVVKDICHEAGHATKSFFKREDFGPMLDHSAAPGLMDPNATLNAFTDREKKILRGIKP